MSVDTFKHIITHINANFADEKDSRHLLEIAKETRSRLQVLDIKMYKILADGGFSSGANYAALEADHLEGYVSLYGQYNKQREGFTGPRRLMMLSVIFIHVNKAKSCLTKVSNLMADTLIIITGAV